MKCCYRLGRCASGFMAKTFWGLKVNGIENLPQTGGAIIASNHRSYADPPILGAVISKEIFFLAKKELFAFKPFAWLMSKLNTVPINRGKIDRKGLKDAIEILNQGNFLVVFPEGTRSRKDDFLEPKLGVGKLALEAGVPIAPAFINNTRHLMKSFFQRREISVSFGKCLDWSYLESFPKNKESYQKIADEVMARIRKLKTEIE